MIISVKYKYSKLFNRVPKLNYWFHIVILETIKSANERKVLNRITLVYKNKFLVWGKNGDSFFFC